VLHAESMVGVVMLIRTSDSNGVTSDDRQFSFYCSRLVDSCQSVYGDSAAAFKPFKHVTMVSYTPGPTQTPSATPTSLPTLAPTSVPTFTGEPSAVPFPLPTGVPTVPPTDHPTPPPSPEPTGAPPTPPTSAPSLLPSFAPSPVPSELPTALPSLVPTSVEARAVQIEINFASKNPPTEPAQLKLKKLILTYAPKESLAHGLRNFKVTQGTLDAVDDARRRLEETLEYLWNVYFELVVTRIEAGKIIAMILGNYTSGAFVEEVQSGVNATVLVDDIQVVLATRKPTAIPSPVPSPEPSAEPTAPTVEPTYEGTSGLDASASDETTPSSASSSIFGVLGAFAAVGVLGVAVVVWRKRKAGKGKDVDEKKKYQWKSSDEMDPKKDGTESPEGSDARRSEEASRVSRDRNMAFVPQVMGLEDSEMDSRNTTRAREYVEIPVFHRGSLEAGAARRGRQSPALDGTSGRGGTEHPSDSSGDSDDNDDGGKKASNRSRMPRVSMEAVDSFDDMDSALGSVSPSSASEAGGTLVPDGQRNVSRMKMSRMSRESNDALASATALEDLRPQKTPSPSHSGGGSSSRVGARFNRRMQNISGESMASSFGMEDVLIPDGSRDVGRGAKVTRDSSDAFLSNNTHDSLDQALGLTSLEQDDIIMPEDTDDTMTETTQEEEESWMEPTSRGKRNNKKKSGKKSTAKRREF